MKLDPAVLLKKLVEALPPSDTKAAVIAAYDDASHCGTGFILVTPEGMTHISPETVYLEAPPK